MKLILLTRVVVVALIILGYVVLVGLGIAPNNLGLWATLAVVVVLFVPLPSGRNDT